MHIQHWPNRLGYDVLDTQGNELGEVWQTRMDGQWGVRAFKINGDAHRYMLIDPASYLYLEPADAVALCQVQGVEIE